MILKAFFDASSRVKSGYFCVAGYAFTKLNLQRFDRDWSRLFGKYGGCHMKELTQRRGRFKDIRQLESDRLLKGAVEVLRKRVTYGIVVSCNLEEMNALLPKWINGFQHAYPVCCHMAMYALGHKILDSGRPDEVAYIFETGDPYSGCAHDFMKRAILAPEVKEAYRYNSHAFVDKVDALALQAADVLAWEAAKYVDETIFNRVRPMRLSLAHLLRAQDNRFDDKRYKILHLTGDALKKFTTQVAELGLLQLREEDRLLP